MKKTLTLFALAVVVTAAGYGISTHADPPYIPEYLECTICPGSGGGGGVTPIPGGPECANTRSGIDSNGLLFTCSLIGGDPQVGCIYQCWY